MVTGMGDVPVVVGALELMDTEGGMVSTTGGVVGLAAGIPG